MSRTIRLTIDLITDLDPGPAFEAARRAIEDNMTDAEVAAGHATKIDVDAALNRIIKYFTELQTDGYDFNGDGFDKEPLKEAVVEIIAAGHARDLTADEPLVDYDQISKDAIYDAKSD